MTDAPAIYTYDAVTGELLFATAADRDPLDGTRWLVPDCATMFSPPSVAVGSAAVFAAGAWTIVADHRGETWWTAEGLEVAVVDLGDPAAFGLLPTIPDLPPVDVLPPPLPRLTFWLAAAEIGVTKAAIRARIDAMPEGLAKNQAQAYLDDALLYRREDPLLIAMAAAEGITETELDSLWTWAALSYS
ncbi:hypothetical protein [Rhizobium sp. 18065]|uniref:hypothetical protein n=1 Tax=Rhizobium sp. 18065 TaxID=2681411 RepID=UPI00135A6569|nr:hypothetical protein [Rhizobium sp. 18065]